MQLTLVSVGRLLIKPTLPFRTFDLCVRVASTTSEGVRLWLNLTPLLRSFGDPHRSVRTNQTGRPCCELRPRLHRQGGLQLLFARRLFWCTLGCHGCKEKSRRINCVSAVIRTRPSQWLSTTLVVVRTSSVSSPSTPHGLGQDVKREVGQLLELHGDPKRGGPAHVC
jgi:hypothetical protein